MKILAVAGSLQADSGNHRLLESARSLAPEGVSVELFEGLDALPPFHVDAPSAHPAVRAWRESLAAADAVLLASPEFGHSLPGALKNAIDWVIGTGELERKVVGLAASTPSSERGRRGLAALEVTLRAVSARILGGAPLARGATQEQHLRALVRSLAQEVSLPEELREPPHPEGAPLELLYEREACASSPLTAALRASYGGPFELAPERSFANLVHSLDGVVSLPEGGESGQHVSAGSAADRFVMALLRSFADAVVLGAGTFRRAPEHRWDAATAYPEGAAHWRALRARLQLPERPRLVLVTGSGELGASGPALEDAWLVSTPEGAARLRESAPPTARVWTLPGPAVSPRALLELLRAQGLSRVLHEGGPTWLGALLREGCLEELFLTAAPTLFGRREGDGRRSLLEGFDAGGRALELRSTRRHGSHLFHRYALDAAR